MTRSVPVKRYFASWSIKMCSKRFPKECLRCFDAAIFPVEKINGPALLVFRAMQLVPLRSIEMYVSVTKV
jgi:hypothetical protein